jgi:two-component system, OmpR family, response regulator
MITEQLPSLSVLVVEDLDDAAQSMADLLTLCGHRVRVATCGTQALQIAADATPDVVLLDIGLPGMSGWEVAERLRSQAVGKQPLVIAVTGYGDEADRWRSADAGVDLHLLKPADPTALLELLARVRKLLAESRREVQLLA